MLDPDLLYVKTRQFELWQEAAQHALVRKFEAGRPKRRERWWRYLEAFRTACSRWVPGLSTARLVPATVRVAQHKRGGKSLWQHR